MYYRFTMYMYTCTCSQDCVCVVDICRNLSSKYVWNDNFEDYNTQRRPSIPSKSRMDNE